MATQAIEQLPEAAAEPTPAKKGRSVLILAIAGVVAGAAAGLFGVGPILAKRKAATHAEPKHAEVKVASKTHAIENIVLNPAGSNGQRFLMVTATFELKDGAADELMKEREAEIRDRILALLGKKTVEDLTDPALRDSIKQQMLDVVTPLFPKGSVLKVFFPQFVIQ
jgi:flagellar basal body-associated protein FliL